MPSLNREARILLEPPDIPGLKDRGFTAVDMHFHTNQSDSYTTLKSALSLAADRGVGVAITDHNLVGNAVAAATGQDEVLVIPGIEISTTDGPHILAYFYDAKELQEFWQDFIRPRLDTCKWLALKDCPTTKLLDRLEDESCVTSAAHPMGYFGNCKGAEACILKGYLSDEEVERLDAYEVICGGMTRSANLNAMYSAQRHCLRITGGTDGHVLWDLGNVVTATRGDDVDSFLDRVLDHEAVVIGTEKAPGEKISTGAHSFARFMQHAPSATRIQTMSVSRSVKRYSKKLVNTVKNQKTPPSL